MHTDIIAYNNKQEQADKNICQKLSEIIDSILCTDENKIWHGHPVWFINENPIVGYSKQKKGIFLLFWSGQSFDEVGLSPEGTFKAAQIKYTNIAQVNTEEITRWIQKAEKIQWDYKNIIKRKGKLERLL